MLVQAGMVCQAGHAAQRACTPRRASLVPVRGSCSGVAGACSRWRLRAASFCPLSPVHTRQTSALMHSTTTGDE